MLRWTGHHSKRSPLVRGDGRWIKVPEPAIVALAALAGIVLHS